MVWDSAQSGNSDFKGYIDSIQPYGMIAPDEVAIELEYMLTKAPFSVSGCARLISGCVC